ncbi:MAG TPA: hypothetical protein VEJ68_02765 [Candidatus Bathyarchaeia archaeon]|nr:hypothetical protein [Candidatus Bathyarchaeia archaeon]
MNNQYVWVVIVIVGIVGGIEIGFAISNIHPYRMHYEMMNSMYGGYDGYGMYGGYDGWYQHSGYMMMQNSDFRQQMYSTMFGNPQYRQEMSEYLAQNPQAMYDWHYTMMNNPHAMQTMMNSPQHLQLMQKMMGNLTDGNGMMGMMNYNHTQGTVGMGCCSNMMH